MAERFVYLTGTISVEQGASVVTGSGTAWGGRDWEGAQIWYQPPASPGAAPVRIGTVAAVTPVGEYEDTELPLVTAYGGETLEDVPYELLDGMAMANSARQTAVYARFAAHLDANAGLVYNTADDGGYTTGELSEDFAALVGNNSLFVDSVSRLIYQYRNGTLTVIKVIADAWTPRGAWEVDTIYALNDLVEHYGYLFVSNEDDNEENEPDALGSPGPASDEHWTLIPLTSTTDVLAALGVNNITISTASPSGGQNNDLWFKVPV